MNRSERRKSKDAVKLDVYELVDLASIAARKLAELLPDQRQEIPGWSEHVARLVPLLAEFGAVSDRVIAEMEWLRFPGERAPHLPDSVGPARGR